MAATATATTSDLPRSQAPQQQIHLPLSIQDVQWDFICSKPLPQLNFILKCFISQAKQTNAEDYMERLENLKKKVGEVTPQFRTDVLIEDTCMPVPLQRKPEVIDKYLNNPAEFDEINHKGSTLVMLMTGKYAGVDQASKEGCWYKIETKDTSAGYLRLLQDKSDSDQCTETGDGKVYLSSSKVVESVMETVKEISSHDQVEIEKVICMGCPVWPQQKEWHKRDRPSDWPSATLREKISENGCYVVPVSHEKSSWPEAEWSFSFLKSEQLLTEALTKEQKQCLLVLDTLVHYELSPPYLLSSRCLKYHFFQCMEKIPKETWEDELNGLASALLYIIDELMYAMINEKLPHYFMPSINLFEHIAEDFLDELMSKVSKLRRDPLKYLLNFDKIYFFKDSCASQPLKETLKPVLDDCQKYHNDLRQCYVTQYQSLGNLCTAFSQEGNFSKAFVASETACAIAKLLGDSQNPPDYMQNFLLQLEDPKKAIEAFEFLENMALPVSGSFLGNMACMYASLYSAEPEGQVKEMYRDKADQKFEASLSSGEIRGASGVDYSVFLRSCGRYTDAIKILLKILPGEKEPKCSNMYGKSEKSSMDANLQEEIEDKGEVSVPSLIFGFYQLCHCYLESGQTSSALELMPDFEAACQQLKKQVPFIYRLLGYSYMDLNDHKKAEAAFSRALEISSDDILASNKQMLCQAMMMSQDQDYTE